MSRGLRTFIVVFIVGNLIAVMWVSGQYRPLSGTASEPKQAPAAALVVWSSTKTDGKFWGNEKRKVVDLEGAGAAGEGKAISIRFDGEGYRGCGLNWKGWFPETAADDVSPYRSLALRIRQLTNVPGADLTIHLVDNIKRKDRLPASNGFAIVADGALARIDNEWRRVVVPLASFTRNRDLDLKRLWGIDFSDSSGKPLAFQIDEIGFIDECAPMPLFPAASGFAATAKIDSSAPGHVIRDDIYGVCDLPAEKIDRLKLAIYRKGGNRSSRFNWKLNADNAGKDWFFKNGGHPVKDPAEAGWAKFLRDKHDAGATAYITVPMLGFVAKDHQAHAFSIAKYGAQQLNEVGHKDVGNGLTAAGQPLQGNDWRDTSIEVGPEFIAAGVRHALQTLDRHGALDKPRYWALDNEPMLWHETHRDVRTKPLGYDELWERTVKYAEAIKQADPTAKVAGFCSWGWTDLFSSAADEGGDGYRTQPDKRAHGGMPLGEWFIKKCGDYKRQHGKSLVDVFDLHWYPQAEIDGHTPYHGKGSNLKLNELRLRSTRDLWDPTYVQESWIKNAGDGKATMAVRRARAWIEKHNPGMELCIGEYNFGGGDTITGALAQADVFGILARERVDLAFIWTHPEGTQELAWQLFRNYDGAGGRFGDRWLPVECHNNDVGVYAAKRSRDGATTIVVVNKNLGGECTLKLTVGRLGGRLRVWRFDQESKCRIDSLPAESCEVNSEITIKLPAASASMLVIQ